MSDAKSPSDQLEELLRRPRRRMSPRRRWIRNSLLFLAGLMLPVVLCLTTVIDCYRVDGDGMFPTLRPGDRVLAVTTSYSAGRPPRRDTVALMAALPQSRHEGSLVVKRIIGLPGDTIEVRKKRLWRNSKLVDEPYIAEAMDYEWGPVTVPPGRLVVLGDNRNYNHDSHNWHGISSARDPRHAPFVSMESLRGRVIATTWPLSRVGRVK